MSIEIIEGDSRVVLKELSDNSVDSVVTDPPYALTANKKGGTGPASVNLNTPAGRARITVGFMGKAWDNGDTAFDPAFWVEVLRVLKPGGHVLSFGGTRTYHRMACAIEDAGFEIRDQIGWLYGSGFPKSSNQHGDWEGWGTALKPAWEPIVVARKPLIGTMEKNLAAHGVGALNIDGCRVGWPDGKVPEIGTPEWGGPNKKSTAVPLQDGETVGRLGPSKLGRWPANIIHDGSDEVLDRFPFTKSGSISAHHKRTTSKTKNAYGERSAPPEETHGDSGSAARFFYCAKASKADRDDGLDSAAIVSIAGAWENADQKVALQVVMDTSRLKVIGVSGQSKNSASEWSTLLFGSRLTGLSQTDLKSTTETKINSTIASRICRSLLTFATNESIPVVTLTPKELNGSHAENAEAIDVSLITTSEKMASALGVSSARLPLQLKINVYVGVVRSSHPTVKPTDLMRYLCRLVTPPGGTVLDPFMGSGSTGRGAVLEGFGFIGIEMDPAYFDIADARIAAAEETFAMKQAAE